MQNTLHYEYVRMCTKWSMFVMWCSLHSWFPLPRLVKYVKENSCLRYRASHTYIRILYWDFMLSERTPRQSLLLSVVSNKLISKTCFLLLLLVSDLTVYYMIYYCLNTLLVMFIITFPTHTKAGVICFIYRQLVKWKY